MKFKVGDKVRVISAYDPYGAKDIDKVGIIIASEKEETLGDDETGYWLDIQDDCEEPYFYESQLELVSEIKEEVYKRAINNLMTKNEKLKKRLDWADEELGKQLDTINKLESYIHELNEKTISLIKGGM